MPDNAPEPGPASDAPAPPRETLRQRYEATMYRAISALENWGRHHSWCAYWAPIAEGGIAKPCNCGLDAAKRDADPCWQIMQGVVADAVSHDHAEQWVSPVDRVPPGRIPRAETPEARTAWAGIERAAGSTPCPTTTRWRRRTVQCLLADDHAGKHQFDTRTLAEIAASPAQEATPPREEPELIRANMSTERPDAAPRDEPLFTDEQVAALKAAAFAAHSADGGSEDVFRAFCGCGFRSFGSPGLPLCSLLRAVRFARSAFDAAPTPEATAPEPRCTATVRGMDEQLRACDGPTPCYWHPSTALASEVTVTVADGDLLRCPTCAADVPVYPRSQDFLCQQGHRVPVPDDVEVVIMRRRVRPAPRENNSGDSSSADSAISLVSADATGASGGESDVDKPAAPAREASTAPAPDCLTAGDGSCIDARPCIHAPHGDDADRADELDGYASLTVEDRDWVEHLITTEGDWIPGVPERFLRRYEATLVRLEATVAALTAERDAMWHEREGWKKTAAERGFEVLALRKQLQQQD